MMLILWRDVVFDYVRATKPNNLEVTEAKQTERREKERDLLLRSCFSENKMKMFSLVNRITDGMGNNKSKICL